MMDYGMFSDEGNKTVADIVSTILRLPATANNRQLYTLLVSYMNDVEKEHPEVWDTDVREALIGTLERKLHRELTIYF